VDTAAGLTVIDTNVFVIDLRYKRDRNFSVNKAFLEHVARAGNGVTSIFNLLEVCGILSFNLNELQLRELFFYFPQRYQVQVVPPVDPERFLPSLTVEGLLHFIVQKTSFGDALIMATITRHIPGAARFVSWDADHFRSKSNVLALTPREFLTGKTP
jgi:hypothetical protein